MIRVLFIGLLMFITVGSRTYSQANLDSLQKVWSNDRAPDTARLDAVQAIIWDVYMFSNPDSAYYFGQEMRDFAKSKGHEDYVNLGKSNQAVSLAIRGMNEEALVLFQEVYEGNMSLGSDRGAAAALTNMTRVLNTLGRYDEALESSAKSIELYEKLGNDEETSRAYSNLAGIQIRMESPDAEQSLERAMELNDSSQNPLAHARILAAMGTSFHRRGIYGQAIRHYQRALRVFEKLNELHPLGTMYGDLGFVYKDLGEYENSIHYYKKSIEIAEQTKDQTMLGNGYNNLALVYLKQEQFDPALDYLEQALTIREATGDPTGIAETLNNLASILLQLDKVEEARAYCERSLELAESLGVPSEIAIAKITLAKILKLSGDQAGAITVGEEALKLALEAELAGNVETISESLYRIYMEFGYYKEALETYTLHIHVRDSIHSAKNQKQLFRFEYERAYERRSDSLKADQAKKEALAAAEQRRKDEVAEQEGRRKNTIIYASIGGLLLVVVFAIILGKRLRVTRKQKTIIEEQKSVVEEQKHVVEEKNKEILDSIQYAKRLQEAILPPTRIVKQWLPHSFILYKPKDIVAGDFYWMETVKDTIYFAAADCTGHGVPGAMVSVVCSHALTKSVIEEGILDTGKILDRTRDLVIDRFEKSEEEVKDGMDISLCALNTESSILHWAGANNPLWIIRAGADEVEEIKADKQPIGKYGEPKPFNSHQIQLNAGDALYIFSDGYPDQFGGERGKKYKSGKLKKFLLSIRDKEMLVQRDLLNQEFEEWRGHLEQIDDVCVIGVRV